MIKNHEFNSGWWGKPVGIITNPNFFGLKLGRQNKLMEPFEWVEFSSKLDSGPTHWQLQRSGFVHVDTQIHFRIALQKIPASRCLESLDVEFASEQQFQLSSEEIMDFEYERYRFLPNVTKRNLTQRYVLWANRLIQGHPDWCLKVISSGDIQGWFLSRVDDKKRLYLTLAMLKRDARISGLLLYERALQAYAVKGVRIGQASFSVANSSVLNIYSNLGARFLSPTGHWIRLARSH